MRAKWNAISVLAAVFFVTSCGERRSKQGSSFADAVAVIGEERITLEEFKAERARRAVKYATDRELLDEMVQAEALYLKAKAGGYDQDPELIAQFKRMVSAKYEEDQLKKASAPIASGDVEARYQAQIAKFTTPERSRVAMIFIKVPAKATTEKKQERMQHAEMVLAEARGQTSSEGSFALLAQKYSEDQTTRYVGGDCGWIMKNQSDYRWDAKVIEALFSLTEPGQITQPVESEDGIYLIKLVERKPAQVRPLAEVRAGLEYELTRAREEQRRRDFFRRQKEGLRIEINHELLASIKPAKEFLAGNNETPPRLPAQ